MKRLAVVLLAAAAGACGREAEPSEAAVPAATPAQATPAQASIPAQPVAAKAAMLPVPKDPVEAKRLTEMGYTLHEDHLHSPGVDECPMAGAGPVM